MAGKHFTKDLLGVQIIKESHSGIWAPPSQPLCLERGANKPKVEFEKFTCDPMSLTSGGKHDIVSPGSGMIDYTITQQMSDDKADYATLFETCNFKSKVVSTPTPGVAFEMKTSSEDTLSIQWVDPRSELRGRGGKGGFSLKAEINQPVEMNFNYKFTYESETLLPGGDPDHIVPAAVVPNLLYVIEKCDGYSINGEGGYFESFEIDWGTTIVSAKTTCPSASYVSEYAPTLKLVQSLTEKNEASWEELHLNTPKNVVISLFDSTGTKKGEIQIPNAVPNDLDKAGTDGRLTATRSFACLPTVGDDNIQIVIFD